MSRPRCAVAGPLCYETQLWRHDPLPLDAAQYGRYGYWRIMELLNRRCKMAKDRVQRI